MFAAENVVQVITIKTIAAIKEANRQLEESRRIGGQISDNALEDMQIGILCIIRKKS